MALVFNCFSACAEFEIPGISRGILVPRGRAPFGRHQESRQRKSAIHGLPITLCMLRVKTDKSDWFRSILVPRAYDPSGLRQESRALGATQSSRFLPQARRIVGSGDENGFGLNLLCLQIHSKPECRWTWPEVAILGADQKERGLWGRE